MAQDQRIRNAQQANAEGPQIILFGGIFAHLTDLRVNAAIEFNTEPMFEAVEIQDAVFDAELAAEFRAQSTITEQVPRDLFRLRGARSQLANARGGDFHAAIIPVPQGQGGASIAGSGKRVERSYPTLPRALTRTISRTPPLFGNNCGLEIPDLVF